MRTEELPNFTIINNGKISKDLLNLGIKDFYQAIKFIGNLHYGRNSQRSLYQLVLTEKRGTCSTKHALLSRLCIEQQVEEIKLYTGIYEMTEYNTPGVGAILKKYGLEFLPEAHCYLKYNKKRYDFTRLDVKGEPINTFLVEEKITPTQIGNYKINFHRSYIPVWLRDKGLCHKFNTDNLWEIREDCIKKLSQEIQE